jgi:hypothetical protein
LIVVYIGLQLLAQQMGWTWAWAIDIWRFWPVFIILLGVSLMWRGRHRDIWLTIIVVVIFLLASFIIPVSNRFNGNWGSGSTSREVSKVVSITKDATVADASIDIKAGATNLTLNGGAEKLVDGTYNSNGADLVETSNVVGTQQLVTLETKSWGHGWFNPFGHRQNLDLKLNNDLPLNLDVDAGASTAHIDLTNVSVKTLKLDMGASTIDLTFGKKLDVATATLKTGATTLDLRFPRDLGVRLDLDAGVTTKTLPEFADQGEGVYLSTSYSTATKKLNLTLDAGVSTIRAHWQ